MKREKYVPELFTPLRQDSGIIKVPHVIREASGIRIFGKRIKSILYTTDVAIIANNDADAILVVHPWTPNTAILNAIKQVASVPVFAGIGGGLTSGNKSVKVGAFAEENGAFGVVLNSPVTLETIRAVEESVDLPIIYTVVDYRDDLKDRIEAGVDMFNISGGAETPELVRKVREQFPQFPIMASGGRTETSIMRTIESGANAITFTAYGASEKLFHKKMEHYRQMDAETQKDQEE